MWRWHDHWVLARDDLKRLAHHLQFLPAQRLVLFQRRESIGVDCDVLLIGTLTDAVPAPLDPPPRFRFRQTPHPPLPAAHNHLPTAHVLKVLIAEA